MFELEDLEELFDDLDYDTPTPEQIYKMYGIFLRDFEETPLYVNGKLVKYNRNPSKSPMFRGKAESFVHVVTRESKIKERRDFDHQRANRIHWIRPILENRGSNEIWYFERINDRNQMQYYYWYESQNFLVILRTIEPDVLLVTSFYVDKDSKPKFRRWYQEYKGL